VNPPGASQAPWRRFGGEFTNVTEVRDASGRVISSNTSVMRVERTRGHDGRAVSRYTWVEPAGSRRPETASAPAVVTIDESTGAATLTSRSGRVLRTANDEARNAMIAALPPEFHARLAAIGAPRGPGAPAGPPAGAQGSSGRSTGRDLSQGVLLEVGAERARFAAFRKQTAGGAGALGRGEEARVTRGDTVLTLVEDPATGLPKSLAFAVAGEARGRVAFTYAQFGGAHVARSGVELERPVRGPDGQSYTLRTRYTVRNITADSTAP
jgi:hypothetical protein